jgi:hypothetical protein
MLHGMRIGCHCAAASRDGDIESHAPELQLITHVMSSSASSSSSAGRSGGEVISLSVGATANSITALYFNSHVSRTHTATAVDGLQSISSFSKQE